MAVEQMPAYEQAESNTPAEAGGHNPNWRSPKLRSSRSCVKIANLANWEEEEELNGTV